MSYELDNFSAFLPLKHRQAVQKHTITFCSSLQFLPTQFRILIFKHFHLCMKVMNDF